MQWSCNKLQLWVPTFITSMERFAITRDKGSLMLTHPFIHETQRHGLLIPVLKCTSTQNFGKEGYNKANNSTLKQTPGYVDSVKGVFGAFHQVWRITQSRVNCIVSQPTCSQSENHYSENLNN